MPVSMIHLASAILATLLFSQISAVSKCNSKITGCMDNLFPNGRPTNIIQTLKGDGPYSYMFLSSSCDEINESPTSLGFWVKSDDVGVMTYTLPNSKSVSKEFPIAEGEEGKGYIVKTNDGCHNKMYLLFQKDHVICTYRCCEKCAGAKPDVGCAVANSHRGDSKTKKALEEGLQLLKSKGLADNLVHFKKHCSS